jgi:hypothetical protein
MAVPSPSAGGGARRGDVLRAVTATRTANTTRSGLVSLAVGGEVILTRSCIFYRE